MKNGAEEGRERGREGKRTRKEAGGSGKDAGVREFRDEKGRAGKSMLRAAYGQDREI